MDMERYGDYNEYEEDLPKSKNPVLLTIKILIIAVCLAVIGVLVFRIVFFNFYPDSIENLYFNEALTEHYNEKGGNIEVKTQEIRAKYDNPDVATFICDNLYVIEGAKQLQLSIRYNSSAIAHIEKELSITGLVASDPELFSYKLACYDDEAKAEVYLDASVTPAVYEEKLMFTMLMFCRQTQAFCVRIFRLCFCLSDLQWLLPSSSRSNISKVTSREISVGRDSSRATRTSLGCLPQL